MPRALSPIPSMSTAASQRAHLSWGRTPLAPPARVVRLGWRHEVPDLGAFERPVLAYAQGRSYGDVCLNRDGVLLDTEGLDRFVAFDPETGLVRAEAGVTLADVIALALPHGWFLPVTPGTRYVSLGGAVANDVHGKNHHVAGTFGRFVTRLALRRSDGTTREIGPGDPLFAATVGGLGLTGLMLWVEVQLVPVESDRIVQTTTRFRSLAEFFQVSDAASRRSPYVVAWIDALRPEGRGLLMEGHHAPAGEGAALPAPGEADRGPRVGVPAEAPGWALNKHSVRLFNRLYDARVRGDVSRATVHYRPFFYPLDAVRDWNRGYGRRGFYQYQMVVPRSDGDAAVREILGRLARAGAGSFLAVLKTFGNVPSPGLLSFPRPGVTLALDLPNRGPETVRLLQGCDAVVREAGGAVYPAKDACMTPESFRAFFPRLGEFEPHVDPAFSSSFWRRVIDGA